MSAFQNNAFQANGFQQTSATAVAKAGARGRYIAFDPKLDVAIKAGSLLFYRGRSRQLPLAFTEHVRSGRLTSKTDRSRINTASAGAQFAFTGGDYASTAPHLDPERWADSQPD